VIRRRAFALIKKAFDANGIKFAWLFAGYRRRMMYDAPSCRGRRDRLTRPFQEM
jgi:hypothetical protein